MKFLREQLAPFFSPILRELGQSYFEKGLVKIKEDDIDAFTAEVTENYSHTPSLGTEEDLLIGECTCKDAIDYESPCSHLWASVLAVEAHSRRFIRGLEKHRLRFRMEDYGLDIGNLAEDSVYMYSGNPRVNPGSKISKKDLSWKTQWPTFNRRVSYAHGSTWPIGRKIFYMIDLNSCIEREGLILSVGYRDRLKNESWSRWTPLRATWRDVPNIPDAKDRHIFSLLRGSNRQDWENVGDFGTFRIVAEQVEHFFPLICETGYAFMLFPDGLEPVPLEWDKGGPIEFVPRVSEGSSPGSPYELTGELIQGERKLALENLLMAVPGGSAIFSGRVYVLRDYGACSLIAALQKKGKILIPPQEIDDFFSQFFTKFHFPDMQWPESLRVKKVHEAPRPFLKIENVAEAFKPAYAAGKILFDYQGSMVESGGSETFYDKTQKKLVFRDKAKEHELEVRLLDLGFRSDPADYSKSSLKLPEKRVPAVTQSIIAEGWRLEIQGQALRQVESEEMEISTEVDWFDLKVSIDFGGVKAGLPELLKAIKRSENTMVLSDGSLGILSDSIRRKYGFLSQLGQDKKGHLSFTRAQTGLLDALLASEPKAQLDKGFLRAREDLGKFEGIQPVDPASTFHGQLRPYQKEGLGWIGFLERLGLGGCLADDMGLGKTVQVLAHLESRRVELAKSSSRRPSLVVVPRSLIFNWREEATRFAPKLKVLDHSSPERSKDAEVLSNYDLVLTTYGVLIRDILHLKDVPFDYVILDESQAIKNAQSESFKAVRLLKGNHRLALSGTPVQNHLGELWSLFAFLNPGFLGSSSLLERSSSLRDPDPQTLSILTKALRPYLLRRTKEQVASDLPPKTEQTIYCELDPSQRKLYDELRDHYRATLLRQVEKEGMAKSRFTVLEALLRLRQAACHPGLLDSKKRSWPSAKMETLLPALQEVMEEDHKVLVFSQFTSFLGIVKELLEKKKIPYLYLDGKTKDRQKKVEQFQTDPNFKLFLISLKAGGVGLNLTAAEYIYLLDPWWNPAVEAQAVDRAHRIGQSKAVFAYRLIVKDTVEEKVLELQKRKKNLVGAILSADEGGLASLTIQDLELLLS